METEIAMVPIVTLSAQLYSYKHYALKHCSPFCVDYLMSSINVELEMIIAT